MNDKAFLLSVVQRLEAAGVRAWIMGGWAEELHGLSGPRAHGDIDLAYPAEDFEPVEHWAHRQTDIREIAGKHFPHKRAYDIAGVMVEITLVTNLQTNFFEAYTFTWPVDTFQSDESVRLVSHAALNQLRDTYREHNYEKAMQDGLVGDLLNHAYKL